MEGSPLARFRFWFAAQPEAMRLLLAVNVVVYLAWQIVLIHIPVTRAFVLEHVALNPALPGILFEPWQLIMYSFLHLQPGLGGLLHVGFNMLWMVWIGREYEQLRGPARLFGTYILGGLGGALLTVLLAAVFPSSGLFGGTVHGASAAVLAIMMTVAIEYPSKAIALMFIGVVRLKYVVIGFLALDILFLAGSNTSVSAHLGGVLAGWAVARLGGGATEWAGLFFGAVPRPSRRRNPESAHVPVLERLEGWLARRGKKKDAPARVYRMPDAEDRGATDVDAILDKISEFGYDSLTTEEKRILLKASEDAE
ncbi:MAG: rhomboid family intramembrane serine protease [Bacteroidetes bacterium CG12_big_fil_rev_8_21_14_0_65_60_17]|nr:MAG: rhomboid family intramembrane serine protease [Bacteroidetes bacterium CG12_big_fil_rev_8_21_14_0_65_60_17]